MVRAIHHGERTPAAAHALKYPPSCLSSFRIEPLPRGSNDPDVAVTFTVKCASCNSSEFRIFSFPLIVPDPSPYFAVGPGEVLFRPPHRLECAFCRAGGVVFDARTQGYDGVLNGGCAAESGSGDDTAVPGTFEVNVALFYNIELDELEDLATEVKVAPSDLFDWISIRGTSTSGREVFEVGYECA